MPVDIEWAEANDTVGQEFDANYTKGVTKIQMDEARDLMRKLLVKYGGREALEKDEIDWAKYKKAMYLLASGSKDSMDNAINAYTELIKRKNLLSEYLEANVDVLFKLPHWARRTLRIYTDIGKLVGQEYLWQMHREQDPAAWLLNVANDIYNATGFKGEDDEESLRKAREGPIIGIYQKCGCKKHGTVYPGCGDSGYTSPQNEYDSHGNIISGPDFNKDCGSRCNKV